MTHQIFTPDTSGSNVGASLPDPDGSHSETLSLSDRTRVTRRREASGQEYFICKEALGADATGRLRHERRMLERIAGITGVPQLARAGTPENMILLQDVDCVPLVQVLRIAPPVLPELLTLALQLAQIVAAVHRVGVVHRDINPSNIMWCVSQRMPMLIDYDLATTFGEGRPAFIPASEIAGTLAYIAPEQTGRTGRVVDQRADLYALGATLFEVAVGRPPFDSTDPMELIHDHLARLPPPPIELAPYLPQTFSDILLRLLQKEPDLRYQGADGLVHDLARLVVELARGESGLFVLCERDFPLRLAPPSRLAGRKAEISELHTAFEKARVNGGSLFVAGAPGVGKSALINELRPMVAAYGGWFVSGKFDQYRHDTARGAPLQALDALSRLLLAEPEAELTAHRRRILEALGTNAGLVAALNPAMAILLGVEPEPAKGDPIEAGARHRQAGLDLFHAIASPARPLVMVLDDLQWADAGALDFIDGVLTDVRLQGLLLVGAYREAEVDAAHPLSAMLARWQRLGVAPSLLRLDNLLPEDLTSLLAEMLRLPSAQATRLAHVIGARTAGNPYDTLELVNALRGDNVLVLGEEGWAWDPTTIKRFVGQGNVVDLLAARIARLPCETQALLEAMACLGGEVNLGLLKAASGLSEAAMEEKVTPALEDGLIVMEASEQFNAAADLRFRHDRVQQAAYGGLDPAQRQAAHLAIARRLVTKPELHAHAAQQYLAANEVVLDATESRLVATVFQQAAANARLIADYVTAQRYLAAALSLLCASGTPADSPLVNALEIELHAALYSLGRLDEADVCYARIESFVPDTVVMAVSGAMQVDSLTNRGRPQEALALGLALLAQLGHPMQPLSDAQVPALLRELGGWVHEDRRIKELGAPQEDDTTEAKVIVVSALMNRLTGAASFADMKALLWLSLESQHFWNAHGPNRFLVASLSSTCMVNVTLAQDYRGGYDIIRHIMGVGEARGYEPETSKAHFLFAAGAVHWFEPCSDSVAHARRAHDGMVRAGDLQMDCWNYYPLITACLECLPTLDDCNADLDGALSLATRVGHDYAKAAFTMFSQFLRSLRGQTNVPGGLSDDAFDEAGYRRGLGANPLAGGFYNVYRALLAAVFGDTAALIEHAANAMSVVPVYCYQYPTALARLFQALALAQQIKVAEPHERGALLADMDAYRDWMAARAVDAPMNFGHLRQWIEAERAWALDDFAGAIGGFDAALTEVRSRQRPWHGALMSERAGLFHLSHGLQQTGQHLMEQACRLYQAWGASAKVAQLEGAYAFLPRVPHARGRQDELDSRRTVVVSGDSLDLRSVLRASQILSSETSVQRLRERLIEVLVELAGATAVQLVLRQEEPPGWFLSNGTASEDVIAVEAAGAHGLLPLSVFRYTERTCETLLVEDAMHDDRFARDPYLNGLAHCSLLAVPILSQGVLRAVLLLENRLSRGAFTVGRLDAVMLIAGQLAVSIENALLYQELEQRVEQRTFELRETQAELVSTARQAGMAEIATNVLHNVGNVLNSVNVSAGLISSQVRASKTRSLGKAVKLMNEHGGALGDFLTSDPRGKLLPGYLGDLAETLAAEQRAIAGELAQLTQKIDHIKEVVRTQQSYAAASRMVEAIQVRDLVEDALRMNSGSLSRHEVTVIREFAEVPELALDRHRILQILVNLISNAKQAMDSGSGAGHRMTVGIALSVGEDGRRLQIRVTDEGDGIAPENLTRIFSHGFTTRKDGHGFGLHSSVLAAQEMGGCLMASSGGEGQGATFTLDVPVDPDRRRDVAGSVASPYPNQSVA